MPDQLVAGHVAVAYTELFRGTGHDVVMDHLDRAAAAERLADPEGLAMVPEYLSVALRITRTMAHALHGDARAAFAAADEAVAVADGLGQPSRQAYARLFGAFGAAVLDLPEETRRHGVAGLEICDRAELPYLVHLITASHSWACVRLGEPAGPHLHASASSDAFLDAAGFRHALPHGRLLLAEIRALAGDLVGARETLAAAAAVAEQTGELVYGRQFARVRARVDGRR